MGRSRPTSSSRVERGAVVARRHSCANPSCSSPAPAAKSATRWSRGLAAPAPSSSRSTSTPLDAGAGAARVARVHRVDHRREPARADAGRVRGRPRLSSGGAALDARRVHAADRAPRQRRGHAQPARVRAAPGRVARPAGRRSSIRRRSPPTGCPISTTKTRGRAACARTSTRTRRRCTAATSCTASSSGRYYARHYKQLSVDVAPRVDFRARAVSRPDLGGDDAVRRHVGLRAGDDPRRGAGASRTPASCGRTRRFRSWRCPTPSTRCCRWRRRRAQRADADGVQPAARSARRRRQIREVVLAAFPERRRSRITSTTSGRGSSTRGRPTWTTRPRAPTGASIRCTISSAPSASI